MVCMENARHVTVLIICFLSYEITHMARPTLQHLHIEDKMDDRIDSLISRKMEIDVGASLASTQSRTTQRLGIFSEY